MTNFPETFPLINIDETDSTNHYLDQLCRNESARPAEYTTVTAQFQTAGKGQRGNSWESEGGKNLLFSYVLYPTFVEARHQFVLSQIASLAVKEELDQWTDGVSIKWPNDVYRDDCKICGMLLENDLCGAYIGRHIAGIGVNINQDTFRSNAPNPVSLKQITGREYDRSAILEGILQRVRDFYEQLRLDADGRFQAALAERYAAALYRREGFHPYHDAEGDFMARLVCVEPDGRFVLEDEAGRVRKYLFKEVQYIL